MRRHGEIERVRAAAREEARCCRVKGDTSSSTTAMALVLLFRVTHPILPTTIKGSWGRLHDSVLSRSVAFISLLLAVREWRKAASATRVAGIGQVATFPVDGVGNDQTASASNASGRTEVSRLQSNPQNDPSKYVHQTGDVRPASQQQQLAVHDHRLCAWALTTALWRSRYLLA